MSRRWLAAGVAWVIVSGLAAGCGGGDRSEGGRKASEESFLFVENADRGSLDTRTGTLRLEDASPSVFYFSDRPERVAGQTTVEALARNWTSLFGGDPPNAALQHLGAPAGAGPQIVELLGPPRREGRGAVSYRVRLVDPPKDIPARLALREASLFIDGGHGKRKRLAKAKVGGNCTITDPRCASAAKEGCTPWDPRC